MTAGASEGSECMFAFLFFEFLIIKPLNAARVLFEEWFFLHLLCHFFTCSKPTLKMVKTCFFS